MNKIILINAVILIILTLTLTACGKKDSTKKLQEEPQTPTVQEQEPPTKPVIQPETPPQTPPDVTYDNNDSSTQAPPISVVTPPDTDTVIKNFPDPNIPKAQILLGRYETGMDFFLIDFNVGMPVTAYTEDELLAFTNILDYFPRERIWYVEKHNKGFRLIISGDCKYPKDFEATISASPNGEWKASSQTKFSDVETGELFDTPQP